jgi:predicted DCC family thiol-disulfide oxidoreductase YuxK
MPPTPTSAPVVLFDGVCNLCNGTVQFLIDHDRDAHLRFAALQSEAGARVLQAHGRAVPTGDPDSVLLVAGGHVYSHSDAALRIARLLGFPWSLAAVALVVPRFVRDAVYRFIARHRYRWFGREESCRVPTPALRARFLS